MIKVLSVFGTRPEVIKMAPVVWRLQQLEGVVSEICTTSQHRAMQDQMMRLFDLAVTYDIDVMKPNQDLFYLSSEMLLRLKAVFQQSQPDWVLVQGDTTTSFIASLAAFYLNINVGHVEAGLRTNNLRAPFPEEANRQLTSRLASMHFAPTEQAKKNLLQEHVPAASIMVTGNTVIDTLLWMRKHIDRDYVRKCLPAEVFEIIASGKPYVLITGHRRESFGEGFLSICTAIQFLADKYPQYEFLYPVHLNPNVRQPVFKLLDGRRNIRLFDPVDYEPFVYLMDHCYFVLTDSGGVQEEAPSLGKPVLVMREVTERPEGIMAGTAKLVGVTKDSIIKEVSLLIENVDVYKKMANAVNPYGDGKAADRIATMFEQHV